ncbi:MAG: sulfatase-like hydrolase/transferase [Kiritimatiellales bacterium]|nr:sulfatase-like hydrolase/transferase [Kiritimatiellales bacterium]MCF7864539.1 sulfatase-like hydrolase/transferase [Kiritimatiellales bacterium]
MKRLLVALLGMCACAGAAVKPNVVLIMADDVGWEAFGCFGAEDYKTPNIDALAAKGVRFAHCYSTPLCTPSRVQIMTGKYNFRNNTHFGYLNPQEKTFGQLMRQAGYKTAIAGKWQLNGLYNNLPGCNDNTRPVQAGFDEYCLWQLTKGKGEGERFWSPPLEHNGTFVSAQENEGKYGPDLLCDFICDFIERNKEQAFFAYYPMVLVHDPFVPTPDTIGDAPRTQVANKAPKNKAQQKANFVAMVNYMDKMVGRIMAKVEELGLAENTIIIFTADNGTNRSITSHWNGQSIQGGKGGLKDMGTHVPLIAYWKGHTPTGVVLDDLVDFTDFYATLADTAGIVPGKDDPIDGHSFYPQITGGKATPREWVLCHYQPYWNALPGQFARTADFKLYRDGRFYAPQTDLDEQQDLTGGSMPNAYRMLKNVLDNCPPAPTEKGGRETVDRPTYPDWKKL